jgi:hypothetical protein
MILHRADRRFRRQSRFAERVFGARMVGPITIIANFIRKSNMFSMRKSEKLSIRLNIRRKYAAYLCIHLIFL